MYLVKFSYCVNDRVSQSIYNDLSFSSVSVIINIFMVWRAYIRFPEE